MGTAPEAGPRARCTRGGARCVRLVARWAWLVDAPRAASYAWRTRGGARRGGLVARWRGRAGTAPGAAPRARRTGRGQTWRARGTVADGE